LYVNTVIPIFAAFAAKIKGAKILFHLHEDRKSLNIIHQSLSFFRRFFCDFEIFVSQYLYTQEHISGKNYYIIPNVLNKSFFEKSINTPLRDKIKSQFNILMICSLKKYKGVFEFLGIAGKLLYENDITFTLVVSESKEYIESYFSDVIIPKNIEIHGMTNNTIAFYEKASIVLNLSRVDEWIETFGLTILEGMSFGLPCIVPPVGGPAELIEESVNGYQVSSYDQDKIVALILSLRNDVELYNRISLNNKLRALDFNNEVFKKNLNEVIKQI
jgi:glycosyltransferase involved in cell wall biosynthesis